MNNDGWAIYEANLQSYRSDFLSSQSIMLAVGAMIVDKGIKYMLMVSIIAIIQIICIWMPVIHYRSILVDFHKFEMNKIFDNEGNFIIGENSESLNEYTYCKNIEVRKKVNSSMASMSGREKFTNLRATRRKIDIYIPCSMILMWLIYLFLASKL